MTTQKDILRTMMTQLDEDSDKIPEGLYLKLCDHLKNLHTCQPTQVFLQRPSAPRRCGRCHHVGHDRRSCPYYEGDKRALDSAYQNGQTPTEAGIERKAVFRSNYAYWSCTDGGRIHFEVDLPEAEFSRQGGRDTCTYANLGSRLEIRVAGKYKTYIGLPAKMIDIGETNWNPQTHCLKIALQIAGVKK